MAWVVSDWLTGTPPLRGGYVAPPSLAAAAAAPWAADGRWSLTTTAPYGHPESPQPLFAVSLGMARAVLPTVGLDFVSWASWDGPAAAAGGLWLGRLDGRVTAAARLGLSVGTLPADPRLVALGASARAAVGVRWDVTTVTAVAGVHLGAGSWPPRGFSGSSWSRVVATPTWREAAWAEVDVRVEVIGPGHRLGWVGGVGVDLHADWPVVPNLTGGLLIRGARVRE